MLEVLNDRGSYFKEYKLSETIDIPRGEMYAEQLIDPSIAKISPLPPDNQFTEEYLDRHHAMRESGGYLARGDKRSPEELGTHIPPKCMGSYSPHYNISEHRNSSCGSGFVSLTDRLRISRKFALEDNANRFFHYIAKSDNGLRVNPEFDSFIEENEHSAIGSVPIVSYRRCDKQEPGKNIYKCGSIFLKRDLDLAVRDKIIDAQLLPYEKQQGVKIN